MTSEATVGAAGSDRLALPAGASFQIYAQGVGLPVRWRLLSGNNRDMGRSAGDFPDVEACLLGVKETVYHLGAMRIVQLRDGDGRWRWQLWLADRLEVVCGHGFDRRTRCDEAVAAFAQLAELAIIRPGLMISGLRGYRQVAGGTP